MQGFNKGFKPKSKRVEGKIRGPGTGTSDDIKTQVPEGSYIMPADSTQAIGEQNLAGMGAPVDVNVSNGEFALPPEQVHAVGVKALNQMRDQTHTPTGQPQVQGSAERPDLFFADGGEVEDPKRKNPTLGSVVNAGPGTARVGPLNVSHLPDYSGSSTAHPGPDEPTVMGAGAKQFAGGVALPFAAAIDAGRRGITSLVGGDPSTLPGGANKYADAASATLSQGINEGRQIAESMRAGARGLLGVQPAQQPSTPAASASTAPQSSPSATPTASAATAPAPVTPNAQPASGSPAAQPAAAFGGTNNVIREGNSYRANGPITEGFTINGQNPATMVNTVRSPQNEQAAQALLARTPEFGAGTAAVRDRGFQPAGARVTVVGDSGRQESERRRAFAAASTPHAGAQNRQLTAAQINAMRGLIGDERTADNQRYATDTSLTREEMSQAGADRRAASRDAIDLRRVTGEEESRGFQTRAAARVERLYEQYEQASTPEEKSAIAEQLRVLSGDSQAPRFAVAAGGQIIDPTTQQLITQPAQIFNTQTGEFVQQQGAPGMQAPPRPGEVRGGYRFKGGNPADQKNWEKI